MLPCDGEGWERSCSSPITPCCSSLLGFSIPKSPREHDVVPGWQGPGGEACPLRSPGASEILSQLGSCSGGAELLLGCAPRAGSAARLGPVCAPWQLAVSRQTDRQTDIGARAVAQGEGRCWHLPLSRKTFALSSELSAATGRGSRHGRGTLLSPASLAAPAAPALLPSSGASRGSGLKYFPSLEVWDSSSPSSSAGTKLCKPIGVVPPDPGGFGSVLGEKGCSLCWKTKYPHFLIASTDKC